MKRLVGIALLSLVAFACKQEASTGPTHAPGVVLTVTNKGTVSVLRKDVERAASLVKFATFEGTDSHYQRLGLREIVLPRAAIHAAHPIERDAAFAEAMKISQELKTGESHPSESVSQGDLDRFGPLVVGTAIQLDLGEWSDPIENNGSFQFVRVVTPASRSVRAMELAVVSIPFAPTLTGWTDIERYLDESVLEIVDPGYGELIPNRIVNLMKPETP